MVHALLSPKKITTTAAQIDLLPTLAGMIHQPYTNKTLGRDLLHSDGKENAAFIIHHDEGKIGIVNDDFFYTKNLWINKEELVPVSLATPILTMQQTDSVKRHLSELTSAMYETARWMLVNNHGR